MNTIEINDILNSFYALCPSLVHDSIESWTSWWLDKSLWDPHFERTNQIGAKLSSSDIEGDRNQNSPSSPGKYVWLMHEYFLGLKVLFLSSQNPLELTMFFFILP
jgi:hypothetical protein